MKPSARPRAPWFLVLPAIVALLFLVAPLFALLTRAPWGSFLEIFSSQVARDALRLSMVTATLATLLATVLGVPLAWLIARSGLPGTGIARSLVLVPLLIPPVVSGVALLNAFGRRGAFGQFLYEQFGIQLPFTTTGVVLAEAFVAMPFLVIAVEGGFRSLNKQYEEAAATLGASSWTTFRRVSMPLVAPALGAGMVLCWARALGEFGATITFAGNFPGVTQTMPLAVYQALESDPAVAMALSLLLIAICVLVLIVLRGRFIRPLASS
ncbi:MAG: ABC transporter permease [Actinomycetota bacterium]|nr:ABC transporter permease [Actinomycetota bacterium]